MVSNVEPSKIQNSFNHLVRPKQQGLRDRQADLLRRLHLMPSAQARKIEAIRVGEKGQIAVPPTYRKLHKPSKGSEVLLIQLGETLMVVPSNT